MATKAGTNKIATFDRATLYAVKGDVLAELADSLSSVDQFSSLRVKLYFTGGTLPSHLIRSKILLAKGRVTKIVVNSVFNFLSVAFSITFSHATTHRKFGQNA